MQPEVSSEVLTRFAFSFLSVGQQFGRASASFTRAQLSRVVSVDPVELYKHRSPEFLAIRTRYCPQRLLRLKTPDQATGRDDHTGQSMESTTVKAPTKDVYSVICRAHRNRISVGGTSLHLPTTPPEGCKPLTEEVLHMGRIGSPCCTLCEPYGLKFGGVDAKSPGRTILELFSFGCIRSPASKQLTHSYFRESCETLTSS